MKILAMDLGKSSTVMCQLDTDTGETEYVTAGTSAGEFTRLLEERRPDRVVMEVGPIAGWVHDLAAAMGMEVHVANPNHEAWRWRNVKRKTDRLDALKLARLSAGGDLPLVYMPSARVRQWRSLIAYRHHLVKRRTRVKNHIRAVILRQGVRMPAGTSGWTRECRERLAELAQAAGEEREAWRVELALELAQLEAVESALEAVHAELDARAEADSRVALLRTIPAVGPRLAELIVAIIDDPHRFRSGRQVGSYAGLAPGQFQSGARDRVGRIHKRGNTLLRSLLVEVSWLALRYNGWASSLHARLTRGSKTRRKIAIVAVARRLLVICWAMLRDGRAWDAKQARGPRAVPA